MAEVTLKIGGQTVTLTKFPFAALEEAADAIGTFPRDASLIAQGRAALKIAAPFTKRFDPTLDEAGLAEALDGDEWLGLIVVLPDVIAAAGLKPQVPTPGEAQPAETPASASAGSLSGD